MADAENGQPTIIIKKKKGGHHDGHHGGAWKVAYADFVTAMMAFFLLLWLLAATTEEQKQGIADYFSPTVASISSESGAGEILAGRTLSIDGASVSDSAPLGVPAPTAQPSSGEESERIDELDPEAEAQAAAREEEAFDDAQERLRQALQDMPELSDLAQHLIIEETPEGLRIQIIDRDNNAMFASGSAQMTPQARQLLDLVTQSIAVLPNRLQISGHTDAAPFRTATGYSNWELSSDRANASRRAMLESGLTPERIETVEGRADRDLLDPEAPNSPRNRRISVLLLREPQAYAGAAPARESQQGLTPPPSERDIEQSGGTERFVPDGRGQLGPIRIYRDDE